jgi:hypothetical protein
MLTDMVIGCRRRSGPPDPGDEFTYIGTLPLDEEG